MARIVVTTQTGDETVELSPGTVLTVGRDAGNRLPFPDETGLSRRHCRIGPREGGVPGWEVADLGSTNKTRVGGVVVQQRNLSHGDVIEIGSVKMRFEDPDEEQRLAKLEKEGVCYLEWVTGPHKGERVVLDQKRTRIGRRESNTLPLDDRMVSGHHAEIDRDVNGYTIRDLGSTNGTLLNGDPVSEALLTHGARLRIGNCRFAFKDPSMKDVEVELAHFEEDEGWGMMGELDLSRSRGSKSGIFVVLLLFLAAGAGGWWLSQQEQENVRVERTGLVTNGDFESEDWDWSASREEGVLIARKAKGGRPGAYLSVENRGENPQTLVVLHDEAFDIVAGGPLHFKASVRRAGEGDVDYVVVWDSDPTPEETKAGVLDLEHTQTLTAAAGGWTSVDEALSPPRWAKNARIGLWMDPNTGAGVDTVDVMRVQGAPPAASVDVPSYNKRAYLSGSGRMDLLANETVLLGGAYPVVRLASGEVLTGFRGTGEVVATDKTMRLEGAFEGEGEDVPATLEWAVTVEGVRFSLSCPSAAAVGLVSPAPSQHVGGTVSVLGDFLPQRVSARPGEAIKGVGRTLVGEADPEGGFPTLIALVQDEDRPVATLEFLPSRDEGFVLMTHWVDGTDASMSIVTDFTNQKRRAKQELAEALALSRTAPGRAIVELRNVAQKNPFDKTIRDQALERAAQLEEAAVAAVQALSQALGDFRVYRSADALAKMEDLGARLSEQFPPEEGRTGGLESNVASLVEQVGEERRLFEVQAATPGVDRLERLVTLLASAQGYKPIAAVYARALVDRYGHLESEAEDIARRVGTAKQHLEKLMESEDVRSALPPVPANAEKPR